MKKSDTVCLVCASTEDVLVITPNAFRWIVRQKAPAVAEVVMACVFCREHWKLVRQALPADWRGEVLWSIPVMLYRALDMSPRQVEQLRIPDEVRAALLDIFQHRLFRKEHVKMQRWQFEEQFPEEVRNEYNAQRVLDQYLGEPVLLHEQGRTSTRLGDLPTQKSGGPKPVELPAKGSLEARQRQQKVLQAAISGQPLTEQVGNGSRDPRYNDPNFGACKKPPKQSGGNGKKGGDKAAESSNKGNNRGGKRNAA